MALQTAPYWIVAVRGDANGRDQLSSLRHVVDDLAEVHRMAVPLDLSVGTLDELVSLSDDLAKADVHMDAALRRIARQLRELSAEPKLLVNNGTCCVYCGAPGQHIYVFALAKHSKRVLVHALTFSGCSRSCSRAASIRHEL